LAVPCDWLLFAPVWARACLDSFRAGRCSVSLDAFLKATAFRTLSSLPANADAAITALYAAIVRLMGLCREFRVWAGMMGAKEPRHAATQRAPYP
jgi:hypothetical protein